MLGTVTIALSHAIAARLFGTGAGLLAALFTALAFLHVRDSHYATTDVPLTFFTMCTMLALVRVYLTGRGADARMAGVFAGLAMGTKYNAALLVVPMATVEVLRAWKARTEWRRALRNCHLLTMLFLMVAVFLATSPYLLLDHERAVHDLRVLQHSTAAGMTPAEMLGRGWTYHLPYSLWYGLGWPLLFAALGGMAWMGLRRPGPAVVLGSFPLTYYVVAGAGYNVFVRYMIPIVPFLCIFAGYFVWELTAWLARRVAVRQPIAAAAMGLAIVAPSAWSVVQFNTLLTAEDSRLVAGRWMHEHAEPGSTIYMSGNRYGHLQLERRRTPKYRYYQFDYRADWFAEDGRAAEELPAWIVVQRSALPYSHIPDAVTRLLPRAYDLVHTVRAANLAERNFHDIQDGFYAPFGGFRGVRRLGPNIEIYRRRGKRDVGNGKAGLSGPDGLPVLPPAEPAGCVAGRTDGDSLRRSRECV